MLQAPLRLLHEMHAKVRKVSGDDFAGRLRSIIEPLAPRFRDRARRDIESVLRLGAKSPADLLAIVRNNRVAPHFRIKVCWILGRLGDKRAAPAMMVALTDNAPRLRQAAAQSLGELRSSRALPLLVAALRAEPEVDVRTAIVSALGSLRDARTFRPLVQLLNRKSEDPVVRGMAAEALADLPHSGAAAVLMTALSDPSAEVRFWAAFGLGQLGAWHALPQLELLASTDAARLPRWGTVREEAIKAIERIRSL